MDGSTNAQTGAASQRSTRADALHRTALSSDIGVLLLVAIAEGALAFALVIGRMAPVLAVAGHAVVVLGLVLVLLSDRTAEPDADRTMLALGTIATACLGPIGALGAIGVGLIAPARSARTPLLEAWYDRISHSVATDPVAQLCDLVAIGRSVDLSGGPPASFQRVMTYGSLAERQALLGLVARKFDVEYLPALKLALTSPEPVIRVQAAAVATKVQLAVRRIVRTWADRTSSQTQPGMALAAVTDLEACLDSGLIEATDRSIAETALGRAKEAAKSALDSVEVQREILSASSASWQLPAVEAIDLGLSAAHRYRELRNWRRLRRAGLSSSRRLRACRLRVAADTARHLRWRRH